MDAEEFSGSNTDTSSTKPVDLEAGVAEFGG